MITGREFDILLEKHVFNHTVILSEEGQALIQDTQTVIPRYMNDPPNYTPIVEEMERKGYSFSLIASMGEFAWECSFHKSSLERHYYHNNSASSCVFMAALGVLGVEL